MAISSIKQAAIEITSAALPAEQLKLAWKQFAFMFAIERDPDEYTAY